MVRIAWLLIILLFVVIRTTTSSADDVTYVTEMEYSTIFLMDTTFSTKKVEMSSIRRNNELRTHVTTTSTTDKPTNATTTHSATSPTKKEQSSTSTTLTKQLPTSKVSTSEETSAPVTVMSPTHNTTPSNVSTSSTKTPFQLNSTTTSLPKSSSKTLWQTIVTATVGSSKSRNTSAEVKSTPSPSYEDRSTTKRGFFSSPVIRSSSETYSSTVTSSTHDGRFTSHAKSTKDADLTTDSSEPDTNSVLLIAAGAGGAIVLMVGAGCLLVGVRKARKRQFWGSGANGSGVAEIGMIFTKTPNKENGLSSEDAIEVDTGLSFISESEREPKAKIKVQGVRDSTEVDLTLSTFTPGPENFKRAQDRNLSDMIIVKDEEDDYFGDGDYRESVAL